MTRRRVDVHAHFVPECYRQALAAAGIDHPDGIVATPGWSEESALATMDRLDVETAVLSISSPGVHFGDDSAAADLARAVNEEAAAIRARHPGRFGSFASLPLPDVDAAVRELRHALDGLGADGVIVLTNHAGLYLGDERLEPVYAELAARSGVLFLHPTTAHLGEHLGLGYPRPMLEFMFDTTRSATDLILSGVLDRHPELRIVVPHAGAVLPVLANRIELLLPLLTPPGGTAPDIRATLRQLHFDLAGAPVPELLSVLLGVADAARIHYGSDFPFTPADATVALAERLDGALRADPQLHAAIDAGNAYALLPRLAPEVATSREGHR
jgi:predicted TIM-barrel fold metal-dependent hydrolase